MKLTPSHLSNDLMTNSVHKMFPLSTLLSVIKNGEDQKGWSGYAFSIQIQDLFLFKSVSMLPVPMGSRWLTFLRKLHSLENLSNQALANGKKVKYNLTSQAPTWNMLCVETKDKKQMCATLKMLSNSMKVIFRVTLKYCIQERW